MIYKIYFNINHWKYCKEHLLNLANIAQLLHIT